MDKPVLEFLYAWFDNYTKSFNTSDEEIQHMITLKKGHSLIVADHCKEIAKSLNLSPEYIDLAEAIGLCHDVGRFKQATIYRTFQDHLSINHGPFGVEQLKTENVYTKISSGDWEAMDFAISCHNAVIIPPQTNEPLIIMAKIVRDADKLDIFRVIPPKPSAGGCSLNLVNDLLNGKLLRYSDLKTPDDRNLVMVSWLYDINYPWTLRQIAAKGYINNLLDALPSSPLLTELKQQVAKYITAKSAE